tara:strand:+ start:551 stop:1174 length:624 start_codon:yes stop_codon:yes gene_type:complete
MKKTINLFLLIFVSLALISCGGNSDSTLEDTSSASVIFEQIEDSEKSYSLEDFIAIGYKKGKSVKEDKLMDGMINAYWGFWKVPYKDWSGKDMIDYELRFYNSHADAIDIGESSADLRTGDNAQIRKKSTSDPKAVHPIGADWPELLKEARECQGDGGHHTGACIIPKYADYKIFGNVIILGQGADLEESHKNINLIVDGLKGVITE